MCRRPTYSAAITSLLDGASPFHGAVVLAEKPVRNMRLAPRAASGFAPSGGVLLRKHDHPPKLTTVLKLARALQYSAQDIVGRVEAEIRQCGRRSGKSR